MVKGIVRQHNTRHLARDQSVDVGGDDTHSDVQEPRTEGLPVNGRSPTRLRRTVYAVRKPLPGEVHPVKVMGMPWPMRKLVVTQNITLDGSIEMLDDWFDPQLQDDELLEESHRQDSQADALLLGRQTFEDFRGYWPAQVDDPTGITDYLNRVAKYVVSSTIDDPGWANSAVLHGDPVAHVDALKNRPGMDIVVTGSITLTHALIAAGLVDEYRLFVYPAVQGRGRRLFPPDVRPRLRAFGAAMSFPSGIVLLRYAAAQPVPSSEEA
jgi:dihydrofolate reductase